MYRSTAAVLACALLLATGTAALPYLPPEHARGGHLYARLRQPDPSAIEIAVSASDHTLDVPLDHKDKSKGTFPIRYYVDDSHLPPQEGNNTAKSNSCFFLMGGEGPNNGIGSSYMTTLAKKYNALLVSIEHRFYGKSAPNGDLSTPMLKYLSSEQALADAGQLIEHMNKQYDNCVWIAFGGSYSGALSAWFRLKYSNLVSGALSSSGVVNAVLNFTAFDEQVATAIGKDCADDVRKVTKAFENAENAGQGAKARAMFGARTDLDIGDFAYMLADSAAMADQYGSKADLCSALKSVATGTDQEAMEKFANFTSQHYGKDFGGSCFYDSKCVKEDKARWQPTARSWWWQKCSELAYFQNAPQHGSLRMSVITLDYHLKRCAYMFGEDVKPKTEETNAYYGGDHPNGTKIFFSDFSDDPWQRASVNQTLSADLPFDLVTCDGCGHCMDFRTPSPNEPKGLQDERKKFESYLEQWIGW